MVTCYPDNRFPGEWEDHPLNHFLIYKVAPVFKMIDYL